MRRVLLIFFLASLLFPAFVLAGEDVKRITPQELQDKLDKGDGVLIVDVRSDGAYESSGLRIKDDIRISPGNIKDKANDLPKDKELVFYCT